MLLNNSFIILRTIRIQDAPRFVKWLSDPKVNKFIARKAVTYKEELKWIRSLPKKKNEIHFAIDTIDGIHIGSLGLYVEKRHKKGCFGIIIGDKRYWNKSYGYHASKLILDYAFKKLKLNRVWLIAYSYNPRAIKLYKKLGFKKEGVGRKAINYKGKFYDQMYMGILRNEWMKK